MANEIYKNKTILYVCFEVNRKNIFNLTFGVVIVNALENDQIMQFVLEIANTSFNKTFWA